MTIATKYYSVQPALQLILTGNIYNGLTRVDSLKHR